MGCCAQRMEHTFYQSESAAMSQRQSHLFDISSEIVENNDKYFVGMQNSQLISKKLDNLQNSQKPPNIKIYQFLKHIQTVIDKKEKEVQELLNQSQNSQYDLSSLSFFQSQDSINDISSRKIAIEIKKGKIYQEYLSFTIETQLILNLYENQQYHKYCSKRYLKDYSLQNDIYVFCLSDCHVESIKEHYFQFFIKLQRKDNTELLQSRIFKFQELIDQNIQQRHLKFYDNERKKQAVFTARLQLLFHLEEFYKDQLQLLTEIKGSYQIVNNRYQDIKHQLINKSQQQIKPNSETEQIVLKI